MTTFPFQASPFTPIRSYDVPQLAVEQFLEGELSSGVLQRDLFRSERLSPKERQGYIDQMKAKLGGNPFTNTLVDLVTNPLVWLTFVTGPASSHALKTGSRIFEAHPSLVAWTMKKAPFLYQLGMGTGNWIYEGTPTIAYLRQLSTGIEKVRRDVAEVVGPKYNELLELNGLKRGLDPKAYREGSVERRMATELSSSLIGSLEGWDREGVKEGFIRKLRRGERKGLERHEWFQPTTRDVPRRYMGSLDDVLGKYNGAIGFRDAVRQALNLRIKQVWGQEAAQGFAIDTNKVLRTYRGIGHEVAGGGVDPNWGTGAQVISDIMGADVLKQIQKGKLTEDQFLNLVKMTVEHPMKYHDTYFPKNLWVSKGGILTEPQLAANRPRGPVSLTGSFILRKRGTRPIDPEDLETIASMWGNRLTPEFYEELKQANGILKDKKLATGGANFRSLNFEESFTRYLRGTEETYGMYVQQPDKAAQLVRAETMAPGRGLNQEQLAAFRAAKLARGGYRGGESLADAMQETYTFLGWGQPGRAKQTFAQDVLKNVHLPLYLGRQTVEHSATYAAIQGVKNAMLSFTNGRAGKAIEKSGEWGARGIKQLRSIASAEMDRNAGRTAASALAKYLYSTHLAGGLSPIILNMQQPWLLGAQVMGADALAVGQGQAWKQMGAYLAARAKQGFKPLSDLERNKMLGKHIRMANFDGEDLIGIRKNFVELLDSLNAPSSQIRSQATARHLAERVLFEYPMKGFEKMEHINRISIAEAVAQAYKRAGVNVVEGSPNRIRLMQDITRAVSETQFGGSVENTPTMFLGHGPFGRSLNNPLMRQFLPFVARSAAATVALPPRIGRAKRVVRFLGVPVGTTHSKAAAVFLDNTRAIGVSAILYELGKNLLGADLSRGLQLSAVTGLVGGERFMQEGQDWVPLPPIVSIPADTIRGFLGQDYSLLQRTLPRVVPFGGVQLSKTLGVLPDLPNYDLLAGLPGAMQKTYVDWNKPVDGKFPLYKGDGFLIGYFPGQQIVLRGLGADLGQFQKEGELDNMLLGNAEEMKDYRRQAIAAYLANDMATGDKFRAEFQQRFGFPLTVTESQMKTAMRSRTISRTDRLIDTLPREARPLYHQMVQHSPVQAPRPFASEPGGSPAYPGVDKSLPSTTAFSSFDSF